MPASQFSTLLVMINYHHQNIRQICLCPPGWKQSQALIIVPTVTLYQTRLLLCLNTWRSALYPIGFNDDDQALPADEKELECGQICVTLYNEAGTKAWYIGYCNEVLSNRFRVEHFHRVTKASTLKWRNPIRFDIAYCWTLQNPWMHGWWKVEQT